MCLLYFVFLIVQSAFFVCLFVFLAQKLDFFLLFEEPEGNPKIFSLTGAPAHLEQSPFSL